MRSSPYGSISHGHADQNAYVIEAFGRGLAIATGYYPWYGSPHHHRWTRATKSVNSVLVDGEGQMRRSKEANGRLVAFDTVDGYDYAEGEAATAYKKGRLERFRRHVVHVRPGVFVMFDDLLAAQPARFQWLMHAYNHIEIDGAERILRVENAPAAMKVHLLLPDRVEFVQTDKYEPEPESCAEKWTNTWHLTASTTAPAKAKQFLVVMSVHRTGQKHPLSKVKLLRGTGAVGVRLTTADGDEDVVAFRTDHDLPTVVCGGIESSGRVFAQGKNKDGQLVRRFAFPRD